MFLDAESHALARTCGANGIEIKELNTSFPSEA
jgi:hypothetical protein